jgi:hypothetical protein
MMALPVPTAAHVAERRCSILRKRALLDSIDVTTHAGLLDRALIGLMVYRLTLAASSGRPSHGYASQG